MKPVLALIAATLLSACATAPRQPAQPLTPYTCNGNPTNLLVDYDNSNPNNTLATVHIADKTYPMHTTRSGSGVRYTNGRTDEFPKVGTLVWWTKGSEGMLYEVATRADGNTYEKQLTNCTSNPQPLAMPSSLPTLTPLPGTIPGTVPGIINAPQQPTANI